MLFVGKSSGQALLMQNAMRRRGHQVFAVDPYSVLGGNALLETWSWHSGALGTANLAERHLRSTLRGLRFDVAFVDNGEIVSAAAVRLLRTHARRVALFNRDNPFVDRDGHRWRELLAALPHYDLFATPRQSTADRAQSLGARSVLRVNFFADEQAHVPASPTDEERGRFGSLVSFVGTWFPERGPFMEALLRRGVPLKIIGHRWSRAENFTAIRHVVVPGYLNQTQYAAAVRCSDIAIAMLSKGNEDVQTSRSSEIPAMGVLLCAERTAEHAHMYKEGQEAVFWSSPDECADICLALLNDPARLRAIAAAGRARVLANDNWAETTLERILQTAVLPASNA